MKKMTLIVLLLQVLKCKLQISKFPSAVLLISNGVNDTKQLYSYVVKLYVKINENKTGSCTGSLLSSSCVLTAAHCLQKPVTLVSRFTNYTLYSNISQQDIYRHVLQTFLHPEYKNKENDIGLVLIEKIVMKSYGILETKNTQALIGYPVTYAGFGRIGPWRINGTDVKEASQKPTQLQLGFGHIIKCGPHFIKTQICVSSDFPESDWTKVQTTRPGDSGGPCFYKKKIVGVLRGHYYGKDDPTNSFTPVYPYLSWIKSVMNKNDNGTVNYSKCVLAS